jgi:hypothetical protein
LVARGGPQGPSQRNGRPAPFAAWTEPGLQTVWIFAFLMNPKRNDSRDNNAEGAGLSTRHSARFESVFHSNENISICEKKNKTRTSESENPQLFPGIFRSTR